MKADQIKERCRYEVETGRSPSGGMKKAIVKVVAWNPKTKSWICKTESGKDMTIKDPKRFIKEVKEKTEPETGPKKKGPAPKAKPAKSPPTTSEPKVSADESKRLIENVRKTARIVKIAEEAMASGLTLDPKQLEQIKRDAEDAKDAAVEAGVALKSGGRSNGMLSGKEASLRVLQEEGRPMRARELCDLAHERGYCDMPGKTPWATIAATLTTDINEKGEKSRFKKDGPGLFAINEKYKEG